jgi:hypothetical protein
MLDENSTVDFASAEKLTATVVERDITTANALRHPTVLRRVIPILPAPVFNVGVQQQARGLRHKCPQP